MAEEIVEEALRKKEKEDREEFLLKILIMDVESQIRDETEAVWRYDKLRTEMAAMYPPGTPEYDVIKRIGSDESEHIRLLQKVRDKLKERLAGL